ncbi:cytochrome c oxidase assembly protein COX18, mitochondrial [Sinocyclocheilus rhinocerous]|uniref:Mitochondrial inner membrane protein COX18-like n=1 Tax=Sinocyclocheilus rhinocerous TaxID=307959 RepID=A0A673JEV4_9TELE|nr:PREDICTED: mitochondrial inner membrane protein COX18-like [Sinocyclocheilus rhinocerous]
MIWTKFTRSMTFVTVRICHYGSLAKLRPHIRSISHRSSYLDSRTHSIRPLCCSSPLLAGHASITLTVGLQPRRTITTDRLSWYESVADSTPVYLTEQLLVSAQQMTGLPWWASIMCTTLALRTAITLPLGIYQSIIIAKVEALQKEIAVLARQLRFEISVKAKEKGWSEKTCRFHFKKNLKRIVSELYVRDNCHPFKASLLIWVQLPMWVCLSLALRNLSLGMGHVPLEAGLATGGVLWFPDLTLPDSTWIMPVSLGLINLLITEIFALRQLEPSKFQKYVTNFIRGISLVMIPIAATVPSSMCLYWLSSSCVGLAHNLLLRSPRFRAVCRIPPARSDSETPYKDIAAAFVAKYIK